LRCSSRDETLARLRKTRAGGHPVIASGAGIGLTAKFTERSGADLVVVYNSGRYRMTVLIIPVGARAADEERVNLSR